MTALPSIGYNAWIVNSRGGKGEGTSRNRPAPSNHLVCWREALRVYRDWRLDRRLDRDDADDATPTARTEEHGTRLKREQRVIIPATDIHSRVEVRAALTDDDLAGVDELAAETLDAEALTL
jgi:hypothetical protein